MFEIIGGDGKTYGPVTSEELRRWIKEGRADSLTKVRREGESVWIPLGGVVELFPANSGHPPLLHPAPGPKELQFGASLCVGKCLGRAWAAYRQDPWKITGVIVLVLLLQFLMNSIPLVGAFLAFLLNGPILGGLYFFCRQALEGKPGGVSDVTLIVRERFLPCFLATTVSSLLAFGPFLLAIIPAAALYGSSGVAMEKLVEHPGLLLGIAAPMIAAAVAMIYLLINWSMAVPLTACTSMDFWESLKTSWRGVAPNFWSYLALLLLLGALNVLGMLCLIIGLFVTVPLTLLATMAAYEQIFFSRATDSR
ncbi:MAG: DUF4339 domain-containing protein [Verrucomicrobia bacterium]|nr:DUF4339 domain-containing protein [Verrucomicrobiota bacterium]